MILADFPFEVFLTPFGIPIAAIVCVFSYLAIHSVSEAVAKVMCNRNDSELKLELLARGMTAEEISRVVEAGRTDETGKSGGQFAGTHNTPTPHSVTI